MSKELICDIKQAQSSNRYRLSFVKSGTSVEALIKHENNIELYDFFIYKEFSIFNYPHITSILSIAKKTEKILKTFIRLYGVKPKYVLELKKQIKKHLLNDFMQNNK